MFGIGSGALTSQAMARQRCRVASRQMVVEGPEYDADLKRERLIDWKFFKMKSFIAQTQEALHDKSD